MSPNFRAYSSRQRISSNEILSHTVPSLIAGHSPTVTLLLTVYCVLFTTLAVFSFVAGLKLWLVKPEAVRFARGGSGLI